jgi:hypothetical protein
MPSISQLPSKATPEFRQVNERGQYVFAVFERFTLRIKDPHAIVRLRFGQESGRLHVPSRAGAARACARPSVHCEPGSPADAT